MHSRLYVPLDVDPGYLQERLCCRAYPRWPCFAVDGLRMRAARRPRVTLLVSSRTWFLTG